MMMIDKTHPMDALSPSLLDFFDLTDNYVALIDDSGRIHHANRQLTEFATRQQILRQTWYISDFIAPEDHARVAVGVVQALEHDEPSSVLCNVIEVSGGQVLRQLYLLRLRRVEAGWVLVVGQNQSRLDQQKLVQLVSEVGDVSVMIFDRDLRYRMAAGGVTQIVGIDSLELVGRSAQQVILEEFHESTLPYYTATLRGQSQSLSFAHGDSTYRLQFLPLFESDGSIQQGALLIFEPEENINTRHRLALHMQRFQHLVENQAELVVCFQPGGSITYANRAYYDYNQLEHHSIIGSQYIPNTPDDALHEFRQKAAALSPTNPTFEIEHPIILPDGSTRWQHWSIRAQYYPFSPQVVEYQAIGRDVTTRHTNEQRMKNQHARLHTTVEIMAQRKAALNEQIQRLLITATDMLDMEDATLGHSSEGILHFEYAYSRFVNEATLEALPLDVAFCTETIKKQDVYVVHDAALSNHPAYQQNGWRSYIGVPVMMGDNLWGVLALLSRQRRTEDFSAEDREYLRILGQWVGNSFERHSINRALQEQEALYRDLVMQATDMVYRLDQDGYFLYVNPVVTQLLGYGEDELLQMRFSDFLPSDYAADIEGFLDSHQSIHYSYRELPMIPRSGKEIWIGHAVQSVMDGGRFVAFQGIGRDMTVQRRGEEERENLIKELDAFAHTVAHDLKNPIHTILGYAELLLEDNITDPMHIDLIQRIKVVTQKMNSIVVELLKMAELRNEDIEFSILDVRQLVHNTLQRLDFMIKRYDAEIILAEDWPRAFGYGPWIEEVWANYISNAIKYGGESPKIEIGGALYEDKVRFWVKDHGPGISPDVQYKIFQTGNFKQSKKGSGIGLSIVKRIMNRHQGDAGVESVLGQGSTFFFELPR